MACNRSDCWHGGAGLTPPKLGCERKTMWEGSNAVSLVNDDREEGIFRVHRSVFVDREIFERERELVFDRSWLFAGHDSEFPKPGDFITRHVAGRPLILIHGYDGEIRALLNTCRHRGN